MFSVKHKTVVITGAAQGMGKAYVDAFNAAGAIVYALDIQFPVNIESRNMHCDVTSLSSVARTFDEIFLEGDRIDVLINNAGISMPHDPPYPVENWEMTMAVNLTGMYYCCQQMGQIMAYRKGGSIINIASINSFRGFKNNPAYVASKTGVVGLTRAYAVDLAKYGIRVNAIAPAYVKTPMTRFSQANEKLYEQRRSMIPMGRWAEPEDMVGTALYLASDASKYVTGQVICVDGGWSIQGLPELSE